MMTSSVASGTDLGVLALLALALLVAALGQRLIGMGFGLIATPALVLALGPLPAVVAINALGATTCLLVITRTWRDIDWRRLRWLLLPALAGTIAGILIARGIDTDVLEVVVGVLVLAGVAGSLARPSDARPVEGMGVIGAGGTLTGLLNGALGVGAPVLGVLAIITRWHPRSLGATLQPFYLVLSTVTVIVKLAIDPQDAPPWPWWAWLVLVAPLVLGFFAGDRLAEVTSERVLRWAIVAISVAGGLAVLISGLAGLLA